MTLVLTLGPKAGPGASRNTGEDIDDGGLGVKGLDVARRLPCGRGEMGSAVSLLSCVGVGACTTTSGMGGRGDVGKLTVGLSCKVRDSVWLTTFECRGGNELGAVEGMASDAPVMLVMAVVATSTCSSPDSASKN